VRWQEHRYDFGPHGSQLPDPVSGLNTAFGAERSSWSCAREEVTDHFGEKPIHVNAFHPLLSSRRRAVRGSRYRAAQRECDPAAQAFPRSTILNFGWADNDRRSQARGERPPVRSLQRPSARNNPAAAATSDSNRCGTPCSRAAAPRHRPSTMPPLQAVGTALVEPRLAAGSQSAPARSPRGLRDALEAGDFYASTGVTLSEVSRLPNGLRLAIRTENPVQVHNRVHRCEWEGAETSYDNPAITRWQQKTATCAPVISSGGDGLDPASLPRIASQE
jgi:hypothetical protein